MKKIILTVIQKILSILEKINLNAYKRLYPKFLRFRGINIPLDFRGLDSYIHPSAHFDGKDYSLISIGKNTTISKDVEILTHDYSISKAMVFKGEVVNGGFFLKSVSIGENCFIGARVLILPGTTIGDNVIIGAGSIVTGNIESNSIYAGNPAKRIMNIDTYYKKHKDSQDFQLYNYETGEGEVIAR